MTGSFSRTRKAQSAMEYLMTYGWAILIIAVVLAALFSLGVFNSGALLGTACIAASGYMCTNPSLSTSGNVVFTFGQNTGSSLYNIGFSCASASNALGPYITTSGGFDSGFYYLNSGGTGLLQGSGSVPGSTGYSLLTSQTVTLPTSGNGVACYASSGNTLLAVSGVGGVLPVGTSFSGTIWMNYTTSAGAPGGANPTYIVKIATITVKAS